MRRQLRREKRRVRIAYRKKRRSVYYGPPEVLRSRVILEEQFVSRVVRDAEDGLRRVVLLLLQRGGLGC